MNRFPQFLYANILLSLFAIALILIFRLIIQGGTIGYILISLIALLFLNVFVSIFSLITLKRGNTKLVSKIWLFVFSIVFFYLATDFIGGYIYLSPYRYGLSEIPDKVLHHKEPENAVVRDIGPGDFNVVYTTNNMGFRGEFVSENKDPSTNRILMLGDSFTFGASVQDDETASYLVEKYLNENSNEKYEVINLGVNSYSPILEYLQLKQYIDILKPDIVIMNFDMSDVTHEYVYRKSATFADDGSPLAVDGFPEYYNRSSSYQAKVKKWVNKHLFITTVLYEILRAKFEKASKPEDFNLENVVMRKNKILLQHTLEEYELEQFQLLMSMVEDSIIRTKELCDLYGSTFILSVYPWPHQVSDNEWIPGRYNFLPESFEISDRTVQELERFSAENEIIFFNAFPYFRNYNGDKKLYFNNDVHFTPAGQELLAKSLFQFLSERMD